MADGDAEALDAARRATLERFAQAWSAEDVEAVLACMTEDCIYGASIGPEPGLTFRGLTAVRAGMLAMLAHDGTVRSEVSNLLIAGDRAVWEWRYCRPDADGAEAMEHGCDIIHFSGDKIAVKQAFRKVWLG